jgi:hypothetical protein
MATREEILKQLQEFFNEYDVKKNDEFLISKKEYVRKFIEKWVEIIFRTIFFWETDDKKIGKIIRLFHHGIVYFIVVWYIVIHTIFPSYFLLVWLYIIILITWLQHIICGDCIFSILEQKLIGDSQNFVDPLLEIFHMPVTSESAVGVTIMGSTLVLLVVTFELISRTILNIGFHLHF